MFMLAIAGGFGGGTTGGADNVILLSDNASGILLSDGLSFIKKS